MGIMLGSRLPPTLSVSSMPYNHSLSPAVLIPGGQSSLQASVLFLPTAEGEIRLNAVGRRLNKGLVVLGVVKIDELTRANSPVETGRFGGEGSLAKPLWQGGHQLGIDHPSPVTSGRKKSRNHDLQWLTANKLRANFLRG